MGAVDPVVITEALIGAVGEKAAALAGLVEGGQLAEPLAHGLQESFGNFATVIAGKLLSDPEKREAVALEVERCLGQVVSAVPNGVLQVPGAKAGTAGIVGDLRRTLSGSGSVDGRVLSALLGIAALAAEFCDANDRGDAASDGLDELGDERGDSEVEKAALRHAGESADHDYNRSKAALFEAVRAFVGVQRKTMQRGWETSATAVEALRVAFQAESLSDLVMAQAKQLAALTLERDLARDDLRKLVECPATAWLITGSATYQDAVVRTEDQADARLVERRDGKSQKVALVKRPGGHSGEGTEGQSA